MAMRSSTLTTSSSVEQQKQNVKNAFALARVAVVITFETYILSNNVFTTGSILSTCAAVLQETGIPRLRVAILDHR